MSTHTPPQTAMFSFGEAVRKALFWVQILTLIGWWVLAFYPDAYAAMTEGFRTSREYTAVELLTAFAFLAAGAIGAWVSLHFARLGSWDRAVLFALFAAAATLVMLEETQWGQPILGYEIPAWLADINAQNEVTLHNIEGLQGNAEVFYMLFCLCALLLHLPRVPLVPASLWQDLRADRSLVSLVGCVFVVALAKGFSYPLKQAIPDLATDSVRWSTEIAELYIAFWALIYIAAIASRIRPWSTRASVQRS